jgi:hypothetical protein
VLIAVGLPGVGVCSCGGGIKVTQSTKDKQPGYQNWDIFLSHASEDKTLVRMLAAELEEIGVRVWLDEEVIAPGQSIRRAIDAGIAASVVGVVVITPAFLRKPWALAELDALFARESKGLARIVPVRHRMKLDRLIESVPLLAGRHIASAGWHWKEKTRAIYVGDLAGRILDGMVDLLPTLPLSRFADHVEIWWGTESRDEVRVAFDDRLPHSFLQRLQKEYNRGWANLDQLREGLTSVVHSLALYDDRPDDFPISSNFRVPSWNGLILNFLWRPEGLKATKVYDSISIRIFPDGYELHLWAAGSPAQLENLEPKDVGIDLDGMGRGALAVARCFLETDATFVGEPVVVFDKDEMEWPIVGDFL